MPGHPRFDVFISYRRDGGFETANLIRDRLARKGYRVFMDVESLRSGKFNEQLFQVIDGVQDVVVILSPQALDRCAQEGDWLRLEIARALAQKRNVVPVMLRNFKFPDMLPADIAELSLHNGVEASQELFDAFIERLGTLLKARRRWNRFRLWRPLALVLIPVLCALAVAGTLHLRRKARLSQVCREVVSLMGLEFVKMNNDLAVMDMAEADWKTFADAMETAPPRERARLAEGFQQRLAYLRRSLPEPDTRWPLSADAERLLEEQGQPTQDMKAFFSSDHRAEAAAFLDHLEIWARMRHEGWPPSVREVARLQGGIQREMMVSTYYAFLELQAQMPPSGREAFLQAKPMLTHFPDADASLGVAELKARQDRCWQRAQELEHDAALLVGKDGQVIHALDTQVKALATKIAPGKVSQAIGRQVDADPAATQALAAKVQAKAAAVATKRAELDALQVKLEEAYQRKLAKSALQETDSSEQQWGKILALARLGRNALEQGHEGIPAERIFTDVRARLDTFGKLHAGRDPIAAAYAAAAGHYYAAVTARQVPMQGILVVGAQGGTPHPLLRPGDVILERKGHPIRSFEDYAAMKDDPAPNVLKFVRFDAKGAPQVLTRQSPATTVLVGFLELW